MHAGDVLEAVIAELEGTGFDGYKNCPTIEDNESEPQWIPCSKKLPEMHDTGILKKVGIKQRSKKVYITIEAKRNDGGLERITDADAELRDGDWYSDTLRWLKAAGKKIEVTAWMPYPEPYNPEGDEKHEG